MSNGTLEQAEKVMEGLSPTIWEVEKKAKEMAGLIKDDPSYLEADRFLAEIKRTSKRIDEERKKFTEPLDKVKSAIMGLVKPKMLILAQAEAVLKGSMRKWYISEQDRKAREARRLQEEARKKAEDEKLKQAEGLEKAGQPALADQVISTPTVVSEPKVTSAIDKGGSYSRKVWKAEVVDLKAFLQTIVNANGSMDGFVQINQSALNSFARTYGEKSVISGVRFFEDVVMGVRYQ